MSVISINKKIENFVIIFDVFSIDINFFILFGRMFIVSIYYSKKIFLRAKPIAVVYSRLEFCVVDMFSVLF